MISADLDVPGDIKDGPAYVPKIEPWRIKLKSLDFKVDIKWVFNARAKSRLAQPAHYRLLRNDTRRANDFPIALDFFAQYPGKRFGGARHHVTALRTNAVQ